MRSVPDTRMTHYKADEMRSALAGDLAMTTVEVTSALFKVGMVCLKEIKMSH